ncbi:hypothetical protein ACFVHB_00365 [Kitasatospora sp. NPDC127111]|uniref:hypothetical protein n=1 Tax=Kitasatospora sp. NPDC127111 TaxID=3345363 RepID=UPI0036366C3B
MLVHQGGRRVVLLVAFTDEARRQLAQSLRVSRQLIRRLGESKYPAELVRVLGYRTEAYAPQLLIAESDLPPLSARDRELPLRPGELGDLIDALLNALAVLREHRLVHRAISADSVLWKGSRIQFRDLGSMTDEGTPRGGPVGADPWRCPDQAAGHGCTDCRDDVYAAGALIFRLATGEELGPAAQLAHRASLQDTALRTLLDGVFVEDSRQRPTAATLRSRRPRQTRDEPGPVPRTSLAQREQQARADFREIRRQQQAFRTAVAAVPPPPGPPPPRQARRRYPADGERGLPGTFGPPHPSYGVPGGPRPAYVGGVPGGPRPPYAGAVRRKPLDRFLDLGPKVVGGAVAVVLLAAAAVAVLVIR